MRHPYDTATGTIVLGALLSALLVAIARLLMA